MKNCWNLMFWGYNTEAKPSYIQVCNKKINIKIIYKSK